MKPIVIVGAGIAGLLAANLLRSRRSVIVVERAPALPNNHSAVLRFRSPTVGDALGIPFRKVRVVKATALWRNPAADAIAYAHKVSGTYRTDRSIPIQPEQVDRWIAPPDLIERMAAMIQIEYGLPWNFADRANGKVISTIPMPDLWDAIGAAAPPTARPDFPVRSGTNIRFCVRNADAFATVYVPDPEIPFYRVSITGDEVIAECGEDVGAVDGICEDALNLLGMPFADTVGSPTITEQAYQKILPIDEGVRRQFIYRVST